MPDPIDVSSEPEKRHVAYLDVASIAVRIRNTSTDELCVYKISMDFELADGTPSDPQIVDIVDIDLKPGEEGAVRLPAVMHAYYRPYTNYYGLYLYLKAKAHNTWHDLPRVDRPGMTWLAIEPRRGGTARIFLSHADPEDLDLARRVKVALGKVGIEGYLAHDHSQLGGRIWAGKIPQAMYESVALVYLWTSEAVKKRWGIEREIRLARWCGIPQVPLVEPGVQVSDRMEYPLDTERDQLRTTPREREIDIGEFAGSMYGQVSGRSLKTKRVRHGLFGLFLQVRRLFQ